MPVPRKWAPIIVSPGVVGIPLNRGEIAVIDERDLDIVAGKTWTVVLRAHTKYAITMSRDDASGRRLYVRMHRLIAGPPDGMEVDHADGNGLNNRRSNLRVCTRIENLRNRGRQKNNVAGFKGVSPDGKGRFVAIIYVARRAEVLGYFDTPEEAAAVYDRAAKIRFGRFARTNFTEAA